MAKLEFSNSVSGAGIVQVIQRLTNTQSTTTSSYPLIDKTVDVNSALGQYFIIATRAAGRWQVDDTNQTDYPIVFGDIVSGQQDYSFTVDQNSNQILDIYKVRIKDSGGIWHTLIQRDLQDGDDTPLNSTTQTSCPTKYDLTANGIFLTDIPNYNSTDGLEIYISRTPSYFVSTDTTKSAGIPHVFHEYLAMRPAYFYCLAKGLKQSSSYYKILYGENGRGGMEKDIEVYHSSRNRDERSRMITKQESTR